MQFHTVYTQTLCVPLKRETGNLLETHICVFTTMTWMTENMQTHFSSKTISIAVLFLVLKSVAAAGPVSTSLRLLVCHLHRLNCWICLFNLQKGAANDIYSAVLHNIIQGSVCSDFCMSINVAKENVLTPCLIRSLFFILFICFRWWNKLLFYFSQD